MRCSTSVAMSALSSSSLSGMRPELVPFTSKMTVRFSPVVRFRRCHQRVPL